MTTPPEPQRVAMNIPRGCRLRNPAGAPLDGRIVTLLLEPPSPGCAFGKPTGFVEVVVTRPSPLEPLTVKARASPRHIPGEWTWFLTRYPDNPSWPPKRSTVKHAAAPTHANGHRASRPPTK